MCFLGYSPENIYFCNVRKGVLLQAKTTPFAFRKESFCI